MSWTYNYTKNFYDGLCALPQKFQKAQVKVVLEKIHGLKDPRDMGGEYMGAWAYTFGSKSLLQCEIAPDSQTVTFFNVVP